MRCGQQRPKVVQSLFWFNQTLYVKLKWGNSVDPRPKRNGISSCTRGKAPAGSAVGKLCGLSDRATWDNMADARTSAARKRILALALEELADDDTVQIADVIATTSTAIAAMTYTMYSQPKEMVHRTTDFVERTVPGYADMEFRQHFRMKRSDFEEVCRWIAPALPRERKISVDKKILATLWYLGCTETFRVIGDRFDLSKGSMRRVLHTVCSALVGMQQECIKWPDVTQMEQIAQEFQQICGFPDVIGIIDGTDIHISDPSENKDSYMNGSGDTSIQLQVVCDHRLLFLDVYTGWPGSVHDAQVFWSSPLSRKLDQTGLPRRFHLLGDSAYPLTSYLMVPFRDDGHLSPVQKKFNKAHWSTHTHVDRAVGLLKGKFRRLKYLEMVAIDMIPVVIVAACVLHNFIITSSGVQEEDIEQVQKRQQEDYHEQPQVSAQAKRMTLAYQLA